MPNTQGRPEDPVALFLCRIYHCRVRASPAAECGALQCHYFDRTVIEPFEVESVDGSPPTPNVAEPDRFPAWTALAPGARIDTLPLLVEAVRVPAKPLPTTRSMEPFDVSSRTGPADADAISTRIGPFEVSAATLAVASKIEIAPLEVSAVISPANPLTTIAPFELSSRAEPESPDSVTPPLLVSKTTPETGGVATSNEHPSFPARGVGHLASIR